LQPANEQDNIFEEENRFSNHDKCARKCRVRGAAWMHTICGHRTTNFLANWPFLNISWCLYLAHAPIMPIKAVTDLFVQSSLPKTGGINK
jgi:hypothetical protein